MFREAIAIQRKTVWRELLGVAISTSGLAKALQGQRQLCGGRTAVPPRDRHRARVVGEKHPAYGVDTSNLAECLMDMKRYAEAETLLLDAERC